MLRRLQMDVRLAANAARIVAGAVDRLSARLEDVSAQSVPERLGRALLRLAGERANWHNDSNIRLSATGQELADLTASTPFTVSRIMSDWSRHDWVSTRRGLVTIRDPLAIARIATIEN